MFVVIVVGIILYSQIKAVSPDRDEEAQKEGEYKILAEGTLNSVLEISTGCYVERGSDGLKDLINYCMDYSFSGTDPRFTCDNPTSEIRICSHIIDVLDSTLLTLFNTTQLGPIPYLMKIEVPANENSLLNNVSITNFGTFTFRDSVINESNYRSQGYKRAPSGLKTWATSQGNIDFELYLYYR